MKKIFLIFSLSILVIFGGVEKTQGASCLCSLKEGVPNKTGPRCFGPDYLSQKQKDDGFCQSINPSPYNIYSQDFASGCTFFTGDDCVEQTTTKIIEDFNIKTPKTSIGIPGLDFTDVPDIIYTDREGRDYLLLPWLPEYISALYKFSLGIVSIVAVIMIMIQGIKILISGTMGQDQKIEGYKGIGRIVMGLLIAWGSFLILYTINPNLVNFKALKVQYVEKGNMPIHMYEEVKAEDLGEVDTSGWVKFPTGNKLIVNTAGKTGRPDLVAAFINAVAEYNANSTDHDKDGKKTLKKVWVTDISRSPETQYFYMRRHCLCPKVADLPKGKAIAMKDWKDLCEIKTGCKASFSVKRTAGGQFLGSTIGHMSGNAIDASANGASTVSCGDVDKNAEKSRGVVYSKGKYSEPAKWCIPKEQQLFIKAMLNNGFCVGLKDIRKLSLRESWHFELMGNGVKLSPFCVGKDKIATDANLKKLYYLTGN